MKIYIDVVFFLNFYFDFILLFTTNYILKRRVKIFKLLLGSFLGSLSTFFLFLTISSLELFIYKIILSILMILTTFDYKTIKYTIKNIIYLYVISIFLGGFLYVINNQLSYKQKGLIFINNNLSINIYLIIFITPLIIYLYIKQIKDQKLNYNNYYKISIYINNHIINATSYLDTGNKLVDPYTHKPVILLNNKDPVFNTLNPIYIPFNTIKESGLIKGYKVDKVEIEGIGDIKSVLVGLIDNNINIDGVDSIIGLNILEDI